MRKFQANIKFKNSPASKSYKIQIVRPLQFNYNILYIFAKIVNIEVSTSLLLY